MSKALIVYATRSGETRRIAELLAEGLRMAGVEADVKDVKSIQNETDLANCDALVLGSRLTTEK